MKPGRVAILAAGTLAALASAWLVAGLRHMSGDDHYFELLAHFGGVTLLEATMWVAGFGRRFAHLLNVPTSVFSHRIMNLPGAMGDIALLAQLAVILGGFGLLLRQFAGEAAAVGWSMAVMGGFALHWYFMPPLSYPLHALNSMMLLAVSLLALDRQLRRGGRGWLALALLASGLGILWPEFNFVLYPIATFTLIMLRREGLRARLLAAWPFALLWSSLVVATLVFRVLTPIVGDDARMRVAFDLAAWASTFGTIVTKALLPTGLTTGILLHLADVPGMPGLPRMIDLALIRQVLLAHWLGFSVVALAWTAAFFLVLRALAPSRPALWLLLAAGIVVLVVPPAVVALSEEYQRIVRLGHVQGAVASAHTQAGFLTVLFAAAALVALRWPRWPVQGVLAAAFGALFTVTLAYNLLMRDAKAANHQRWLAFALMVEAVPEGTTLRAPSLWLTSGVSAIPGGLTFGMTNYWTERARIWHRKAVSVSDADAVPTEGEIFAAYGIRPDGEPLVMLRQGGSAELVARSPLPVDLDPALGVTWSCGTLCRLRVPDEVDAARLLRPVPQPPRSLLGWWLVPRQGGVGQRASWR